jgi:hypothetical protein
LKSGFANPVFNVVYFEQKIKITLQDAGLEQVQPDKQLLDVRECYSEFAATNRAWYVYCSFCFPFVFNSGSWLPGNVACSFTGTLLITMKYRTLDFRISDSEKLGSGKVRKIEESAGISLVKIEIMGVPE